MRPSDGVGGKQTTKRQVDNQGGLESERVGTVNAKNVKTKLRKKALKAATRAEKAAARAERAARLVREAVTADDGTRGRDDQHAVVGERPDARFTTKPRGSG